MVCWSQGVSEQHRDPRVRVPARIAHQSTSALFPAPSGATLPGRTAGTQRKLRGWASPGTVRRMGSAGVGGFSSSAAPTFRPLNSNRGILIGHAEPSGVGERVPPGAGGDSAKDKQRTWGRTSVHARAPHAPLPHRTEPAAQGARSDTSTLGGQLRADRQLLSATHPEVAAELEFRAGRAPPPFAGARARARSTAPGDAGGGAPSVLDLGAGGAELSRVDAILRDALGALQVPSPFPSAPPVLSGHASSLPPVLSGHLVPPPGTKRTRLVPPP